jgi:hypothetical protein
MVFSRSVNGEMNVYIVEIRIKYSGDERGRHSAEQAPNRATRPRFNGGDKSNSTKTLTSSYC